MAKGNSGKPQGKPSSPAVSQSMSAETEAMLRQAMRSGGSSRGMMSVAESIAESMAALGDSSPAMRDKAYIKDHYSNSLTSTGGEDKVKTFSTYGFSSDTLNWPLWLALYNDSWVFRRAIDKPARDEVTSGFILHGEGDYSKIYSKCNSYRSDLIELLQWGALFGGSIAVMLFEGSTPEEMLEPLKKKQVKGREMRLYVTDRWYGVECSPELVSNMRDPDYGKPMWYTVTLADGTQRKIHHDWVLRCEHRSAPRLLKNGQLQGWGYAEGSHIISELSRDDQLKTAITSLVNKALIEVIHMSGMRGVFMGTDKGNEAQLRKRLEMVNWGRTFNSLTFLDKDDEYQHFELGALSGLADLMEKNMWLISSALEMQGILFGDLKGGLSQESDAFFRYSKTIKSRCESFYRPALYKLLKVLFAIEGIDGSPDFEFGDLDKEESDKKKVSGINDLALMLSRLMADGVISKYRYAKTLRSYVNEGTINLALSEEDLSVLRIEEEESMLKRLKESGAEPEAPQGFFPRRGMSELPSGEEAGFAERGEPASPMGEGEDAGEMHE